MKVAGEEWYRVRVAVEGEGDAQISSMLHAGIATTY